MSDSDQPRPLLRVVRGDPTPEELAALLAVVSVQSRATVTSTSPSPTSAWTDRSRLVRRAVHPGPDGWRRSALPG